MYKDIYDKLNIVKIKKDKKSEKEKNESIF